MNTSCSFPQEILNPTVYYWGSCPNCKPSYQRVHRIYGRYAASAHTLELGNPCCCIGEGCSWPFTYSHHTDNVLAVALAITTTEELP